ncbi:MAG: hypothetical protein U1F68_21170 [Gammaproteobacteria bacterium]
MRDCMVLKTVLKESAVRERSTMNYTVITTIQAPTAASLQMIAAGRGRGSRP